MYKIDESNIDETNANTIGTDTSTNYANTDTGTNNGSTDTGTEDDNNVSITDWVDKPYNDVLDAEVYNRGFGFTAVHIETTQEEKNFPR